MTDFAEKPDISFPNQCLQPFKKRLWWYRFCGKLNILGFNSIAKTKAVSSRKYDTGYFSEVPVQTTKNHCVVFPKKHHFCTICYLFPAGLAPDGTRYKTDYRCEGDNMTLTCEDDSEYDLDDEDGDDDPASIEVVRGNFGRFSIAVCNRHGRQVRIGRINVSRKKVF